MRIAALLLALAFPTVSLAQPLSPNGLCGTTRSCRSVLDAWNAASWTDVVDDSFHTGPQPLATVRWYSTEGSCTGTSCNGELRQRDGYTSSVEGHRFLGVTDEFGNVLLAHSMGSDQDRYQKLRNFSELLRMPAPKNLQCWKFFIDGQKNYAAAADVCIENDSASDASLRILGAYGIACAKQRSGEWQTSGFSNYCADYELQGDAIWTGEIARLANGDAFLANGSNNRQSAPGAAESFRPDYYELQFLMDFARYTGDVAKQDDVLDMLGDYIVSMGTNSVHRGLHGSFDATTSTYTPCDYSFEIRCTPKPYMDKLDTWRAVPALSGLLAMHPDLVPPSMKSSVFDKWWTLYGGGNALYGPEDAQPMEIYSNAVDGGVKYTEHSYKSLSMWIPLGAAYDPEYVRDAIHQLVDVKYDWTNQQFYGAAYYGAYFSQFAQRAIGIATGLIAPSSYAPESPARVTATQTDGTTINISWSAVAAADVYDVQRSSDGDSYGAVGTTAAISFNDVVPAGDAAFLYRVRARKSSGLASAFSAPDLATTVPFTDATIQPRVTVVRAAHVTELRRAVNAVRALSGLGAYPFSGTPPVVISAVHLTELRSGLDAARSALGLPPVTYTDASVVPGLTVKAAHVQELRTAVR